MLVVVFLLTTTSTVGRRKDGDWVSLMGQDLINDEAQLARSPAVSGALIPNGRMPPNLAATNIQNAFRWHKIQNEANLAAKRRLNVQATKIQSAFRHHKIQNGSNLAKRRQLPRKMFAAMQNFHIECSKVGAAIRQYGKQTAEKLKQRCRRDPDPQPRKKIEVCINGVLNFDVDFIQEPSILSEVGYVNIILLQSRPFVLSVEYVEVYDNFKGGGCCTPLVKYAIEESRAHFMKAIAESRSSGKASAWADVRVRLQFTPSDVDAACYCYCHAAWKAGCKTLGIEQKKIILSLDSINTLCTQEARKFYMLQWEFSNC